MILAVASEVISRNSMAAVTSNAIVAAGGWQQLLSQRTLVLACEGAQATSILDEWPRAEEAICDEKRYFLRITNLGTTVSFTILFSVFRVVRKAPTCIFFFASAFHQK